MKTSEIKTILPNNERMKALLKELNCGGLTMAEFEKECAYWLISCEGLKPKLLPTKPQKMMDYEQMVGVDKIKVPMSFWRKGDIYSYLETYQHIKNRNKGILDKLKEFKEHIPKQDTLTRSKYDIVITQFWDY